jgi:hypothetical protein
VSSASQASHGAPSATVVSAVAPWRRTPSHASLTSSGRCCESSSTHAPQSRPPASTRPAQSVIAGGGHAPPAGGDSVNRNAPVRSRTSPAKARTSGGQRNKSSESAVSVSPSQQPATVRSAMPAAETRHNGTQPDQVADRPAELGSRPAGGGMPVEGKRFDETPHRAQPQLRTGPRPGGVRPGVAVASPGRRVAPPRARSDERPASQRPGGGASSPAAAAQTSRRWWRPSGGSRSAFRSPGGRS